MLQIITCKSLVTLLPSRKRKKGKKKKISKKHPGLSHQPTIHLLKSYGLRQNLPRLTLPVVWDARVPRHILRFSLLGPALLQSSDVGTGRQNHRAQKADQGSDTPRNTLDTEDSLALEESTDSTNE